MKTLKSQLRALWRDESGQSTVEYILILAVVVMVATKFRKEFGDRLGGIVGRLGTDIDNATQSQGN